MKILVPLRSFDQIDKFIENGADEFYFGFDDLSWSDRFGNSVDINRMSAMKSKANTFSINDLSKLISLLRSKNKGSYITLNGNGYTKKQIEYFKYILKEVLEEKPDGVIFSDFQLVKVLNQLNITSVASTMCAIYNDDILEFYKKQGIKRAILPRDLSLEEIEQMVSNNQDVEIEAFLMRNGCMFSDSNCLGVHSGNFGGLCSFLRNSDNQWFSKENNAHMFNAKYRLSLYNDMMLKNACGLCAIYRLIKANVTAAKIVGRADRTEELAKDIYYVKRNIAIAESCNSEKEYLEKMMIPDRWKMACGLSCYYPEVLEERFL